MGKLSLYRGGKFYHCFIVIYRLYTGSEEKYWMCWQVIWQSTGWRKVLRPASLSPSLGIFCCCALEPRLKWTAAPSREMAIPLASPCFPACCATGVWEGAPWEMVALTSVQYECGKCGLICALCPSCFTRGIASLCCFLIFRHLLLLVFQHPLKWKNKRGSNPIAEFWNL